VTNEALVPNVACAEEPEAALAGMPRAHSSRHRPARDDLTLLKTTVVHSGARDGYQVARALYEAGMLQELVTDLYWPSDRMWVKRLSRLLPASARALLMQRNEPHLPSAKVRQCIGPGLIALLLDKLPGVPFSWRRKVTRKVDASLGRAAGVLANSKGTALLSYSYYGFDAFNHYRHSGMLFQLHPHPLSVRRILQAELEEHPDCAESLLKEWELSLPEEDFAHLVRETRMASRFIAASTFTKRTLVEHGISPEMVHVIPYGVDCTRFTPSPDPRKTIDTPLRLLFVGRINQRKGIKYLLQSLRLLNTKNIRLTVCGRAVDELQLFKPFAGQVEVRLSVGARGLLAAYREADLFVFPSLAEGFGHVLLESLACGLPILSTTNTAAPDLIEPGVEGFVVDPKRPDALAERIDWALAHRVQLISMGRAARRRAEEFTWERFRKRLVETVREISIERQSQPERVARHV
jgi:glycosyltransferase involved in cell wall biosynthesis